jgi:sugar lactone lactonase YvrE
MATGIHNAQAVELLVSSGGTDSVVRYDGRTGAFIDIFASGGGLDSPNGLVFGPDGNLYVGSTDGELGIPENNRVLRYDGTTGAFIDTFVAPGAGGLGEPDGITFGLDGNLYVANTSAGNVLRYDGTSGAFIDIFASGDGLGADGLLFGPDGNLYVSSDDTNEVRRFDGTTGVFIDTFVSAGAGGLNDPERHVFGPDGNFYVTSFKSDNVLRYDGTTGAFIDIFASGGGLVGPLGLGFGPDGNLYVANESAANVLRYDGRTGAFIDIFATGGLDFPGDLVFNPTLPVLVNIDIKPGNKLNIINPRAKGGIWVAVLSGSDTDDAFDPLEIDIATVRFGPDGAEAVRHKVKDVNKDGVGDLLLRFEVAETGIACGDTEVTLTGQTESGTQIRGTDSITTVGCNH